MPNQNSVHPVKAILISNFHSQTRNLSFVALVWLVATVALATFCQLASAQNQQYSALEVAVKYRVKLAPYNADADQVASYKRDNRDSERNQRESLAKVKAILNNNGNFSDPIISEYFDGFEFPSMTTLDERVLSKLGEKRTKFIKDYLNSNVTGNARSGLIGLTIAATQKICADSSLHPAARLNAVYLMGMLDDVAPIRSPVQLPVPSKAAFESLRKILDSSDDKSFPDYLKVAALAGIQRHVEIDRLVGGVQISAADKQALLAKAATLLDETKNDDLSYWLKRRGMQLTGLIGDPGSIDRVLSVLKSEDAEFWLRFDALDTIGKLNLGTDTQAKNLEAAVAITEYLASSFERESKSIEDSVDKLVFNQLLFENIDLVETGTNYEANQSAETGTAVSGDGGLGGAGGGRSSGGSGGSGKFSPGGGAGGAGMGAGMGAGGPPGGPPGGAPGGGFGFGAGGGSSGGTPAGPTVELPVYQLNIIRRRIKALAFTGSQVLGGSTGTDGLSKSVDANGQTFIAKVVQDLNNTLNESNAGIIDLEARKKADDDEPVTDEEPIGVTQQLINLCAKSGKTLGGFVRTQKGESETVPAEAAVGAPVVPAAGDNPNN